MMQIVHTLSKTALFVLFVQFTGCAVIHFENGAVIPDPEDSKPFSFSFGLFDDEVEDKVIRYDDASTSVRYRKWYHHATFQIAEINNPLETSLVCAGLEWNQVTTEVTPFDAFVGLLDNALLFNASAAWLDLWSPWSIEYSCRNLR